MFRCIFEKCFWLSPGPHASSSNLTSLGTSCLGLRPSAPQVSDLSPRKILCVPLIPSPSLFESTLRAQRYSSVSPTATHIFSRSCCTTKMRKLLNVWINEGLKMACFNRKLIFDISDSSQVHTSSSLHSSLFLLPDCENMNFAVEILFLSRVKAEMSVVVFLLPVNGTIL